MTHEHWTLKNFDLRSGDPIGSEMRFSHWDEYNGLYYAAMLWVGNTMDLGIAGRKSTLGTPFYLLNLFEAAEQTGVSIESLILTTISGIVQAEFHNAPHWTEKRIFEAAHSLGLPINDFVRPGQSSMLYREDLRQFATTHVRLDYTNPGLAPLVENPNLHMSCLNQLYRDSYIYQNAEIYWE